jgi:hypothetical protein
MGQEPPPLPKLARPRERYHVAKSIRTLLDILCDAVLPGQPRGSSYESLLCYLAVMEAHCEGLHYGATKIAHATGLPRTTVLRKLKPLLANGQLVRVGTAFAVNAEWANTQESRDALAKAVAHQHVTLREIEHASNMDTLLEKSATADTSPIFKSYLDPVPN